MRLVAGIDEVDGLSAESFLLDYLAVQRPVLVRNALRGAAWQSVLPRWSRETLLRDFGDLEVSAGSIPYAHNFGFAVRWCDGSDKAVCGIMERGG